MVIALDTAEDGFRLIHIDEEPGFHLDFPGFPDPAFDFKVE